MMLSARQAMATEHFAIRGMATRAMRVKCIRSPQGDQRGERMTTMTRTWRNPVVRESLMRGHYL